MSYGPSPNLAGGLFMASAGGDDGTATCGVPDTGPGDGGGAPGLPPITNPPFLPSPFPLPGFPPGQGGNNPIIPPLPLPAMPLPLPLPLPVGPGNGGWGPIGGSGNCDRPCFDRNGGWIDYGSQFGIGVPFCCKINYYALPASVPGPDAPFSLKIKLSEDPFFGPTVRGLSLTCQDTGVTLTSTCDYMIFNFPTSSVTVKFTSPAGVGQLCTDSSSHNYVATSNSATVNSLPTFVSFQVTRA